MIVFLFDANRCCKSNFNLKKKKEEEQQEECSMWMKDDKCIRDCTIRGYSFDDNSVIRKLVPVFGMRS